jgi:O-acetyl-ADP-ribose deacetylase (regulator of RNase III)
MEAKEHVIAHQINCLRAMGSGVALAIRKKYPRHYEDFMNDSRTPDEKFGTSIMTEYHDRVIFGLYGQMGYSNRNICNTDYPKFTTALMEMLRWCNTTGVTEIGLPYKIGCDLAGGDWKNINQILTSYSEWYKVDFVLYDLFNKAECKLCFP